MENPGWKMPVRVSFDFKDVESWKLLEENLNELILKDDGRRVFREFIQSLPRELFSNPPKPAVLAALKKNPVIRRCFLRVYVCLRIEIALQEEENASVWNTSVWETLDQTCDWFGEVLDCAEFGLKRYPDPKKLLKNLEKMSVTRVPLRE